MLFACGSDKKDDTKSGKKENVLISKNFSVDFISGGEGRFDSKKMEGVTMVSIVSDYCAPCKKELEAFKDIRDNYTSEQLTSYVMIAGKSEKTVKTLKEMNIKSPVLNADSLFLGKMQIRSVPSRILFKDDQEITRLVGSPTHNEAEFSAKINELLGIVVIDSAKTIDSLSNQ